MLRPSWIPALGQIVTGSLPGAVSAAKWFVNLPDPRTGGTKQYVVTMPEFLQLVADIKANPRLGTGGNESFQRFTDKSLWQSGFFKLTHAEPKAGVDPASRRSSDYTRGRDVTYFPTALNAVDWVGMCTTLHVNFEKGFFYPGPVGPFFIEPGVFSPDKDWARMFSESAILRAGEPNPEGYVHCSYFFRWDGDLNNAADLLGPTGQQTAIQLQNNGKVLCEKGGESFGPIPLASPTWSFKTPDKYTNSPIVAQTAAQWIARYNKGGGPAALVCQRPLVQEKVIDVATGHSYVRGSYVVTKIGPNGPEGTLKKVLYTPLAEAVTSVGDNVDYYAAEARAWNVPVKIFGVDPWPGGATRGRWKDTKQEFDLLTPVPLPPGGGPVEKKKPTTANVLGMIGLGAGVLLAISALVSSRKGEG